MSTVERGSFYNVGLRVYSERARTYSEACLAPRKPSKNIGFQDVVRLTNLAANTLFLHREVRDAIKKDTSLPDIIRNDPPSLRSTLWMVMVRDVIKRDLDKFSEAKEDSNELETYPYTLFALTRCWLSGMDDVMDQSKPPISKKSFMSNPKQNEITSVLARYFHRLYRQKPEQKEQIKDTVRQYRHVRDHWSKSFNYNEGESSHLDFKSALKYNIEAMGPITYLLTRTLSVDYILKPNLEKELNQALTYYAAAGKLIDDMTDWLKDYRNGESNLFNIALVESGEHEAVADRVGWLKNFGKRVFIPISIFKILAPEASKRYFEQMDIFIGRLEETRFSQLTMSMKGVRRMMWVYALNESLPQV